MTEQPFRRLMPIGLALLLASCGSSAADSQWRSIAPRPDERTQAAPGEKQALQPPEGKLPDDVVPQRYRLSLRIVPEQRTFSGIAEIDVVLRRPLSRIWLHGDDLRVREVSIAQPGAEARKASWKQVAPEGVAKVELAEILPAGPATLRFAYEATFDEQLKGLYHVKEGQQHYAFTQFEATSARLAFPSFDEPRFKTPFEVDLTVLGSHVAAANTPAAKTEEAEEGFKRVHFETTKPLPTYLVAWAVGPLDVVESEAIASKGERETPIPFRGLAVQGKGEQLAFALEHTPALLHALESYFGSSYPFEKLDIVAVPDFAAGAMENAGLVTFREELLLLDAQAPEWQKRAFAYVMAHELAHQWFGNLVTMPWWDDIWLNEAFATWMGFKAVAEVHPEHDPQLAMLADVHEAMRHDSLVTARRIRQPIVSHHDIRNAFDPITYEKGGAVLQMFEHWMGADSFQQAIRAHMAKYQWSTATAEDLIASLAQFSDRDIEAPFRTFLEQPGVPFVKASVACEGERPAVTLRQQRYLPVGSQGNADRQWKIPACLRYGAARGKPREQCVLLQDEVQELQLDAQACPPWVHPNADAAGYFRFVLKQDDWKKLRTRGWRQLTDLEKLAIADSVRAAFDAASLPAEEIFPGLDTLSRDANRHVAEVPLELVDFARDYLVDEGLQPRVAAFGKKLVHRDYVRLGWRARPREPGERGLRRAAVIRFLVWTVQDPAVRRRAAQLGRRYVDYPGEGKLRPEVLDANLAGTALAVAVQQGDAAFFDHVLSQLWEQRDALVRHRMLAALGRTTDPELAKRATKLTLDERLRANERMVVLRSQMALPEMREPAWRWVEKNIEALRQRMPTTRVGRLPLLATPMCDHDAASRIETFFEEFIDELPGGPRNLAGALEAIRLCASKVAAHRESAQQFFEEH